MSQQSCCPHQRTPTLAIEAKYIGIRTGSGVSVAIQTHGRREQLRPRPDLIRHSPIGFDWARSGSGAAQLALALLAHASGDDDFALEHYQVFNHEIISRLPRMSWELTPTQVLLMLRFVAQGVLVETLELQPKPVDHRKTAIIHARLSTGSNCVELTAQGSAGNIGDAVTRAIRNILRDPRLRNRPIVQLPLELSVINVENPGRRVSKD
jgi:hypothetical protein